MIDAKRLIQVVILGFFLIGAAFWDTFPTPPLFENMLKIMLTEKGKRGIL